MSKGFGIFAQNVYNEGHECDYLTQAYALALSIKIHCGKQWPVFVMTNDEVPDHYREVFDEIVPIPWGDMAENSLWKIENRWKMYHKTPFRETIVLDSDCLVMRDITHWWDILEGRTVSYGTNPITYTGRPIQDTYRKTFIANDLPDVYNTIFYFKKSPEAKAYFTMVEIIVNNWHEFYLRYAPKNFQKFPSMDLTCAIAAKLTGMSNQVTDQNFIPFIHMKPKCQGWENAPLNWTNVIGSYINNQGHLKLGNHRITDVFHYVEPEFLTNKVITALENIYHV